MSVVCFCIANEVMSPANSFSPKKHGVRPSFIQTAPLDALIVCSALKVPIWIPLVELCLHGFGGFATILLEVGDKSQQVVVCMHPETLLRIEIRVPYLLRTAAIHHAVKAQTKLLLRSFNIAPGDGLHNGLVRFVSWEFREHGNASLLNHSDCNVG
ncbi:hypothetical protein KC359_g227 [Hortaea werneckii]|nr:hypothetical protein KC359_g227 [Hortaea werneckii]